MNQETKEKIKKEVGELLYDLILKDTSEQRSAVTGQKWKGLSKEYKEYKKKIAPGIANLELTGNMLDALKTKNTTQGVEIGIFGAKQAIKAENHLKTTKRSLKTALPQRQFLPLKNQKFRPGILKELKAIAEEIVEDDQN